MSGDCRPTPGAVNGIRHRIEVADAGKVACLCCCRIVIANDLIVAVRCGGELLGTLCSACLGPDERAAFEHACFQWDQGLWGA
jgi:hypothetical protein